MIESTNLACRLIGKELAERKVAIAVELLDHADSVEERTDGYELRWSDGELWAERVLELVRLERQCCPFIRFEIVVEPDDGPVTLRLLGNDEVKRFIRAELVVANP